MTQTKAIAAALAAVAVAIPTVAFAHSAPVHGTPFAAGYMHPLGGLDHVLAMVAVGIWAAQRGGSAIWVWPATFVGIMLAGGAAGMAGLALPMLEPGIAASVLVLGLLIAGAVRLSAAAGAALIAVFALFHGNAHGLEAAGSGLLAYAAGFSIATAFLHAIGIALGRLAADRMLVLRASGVVVAIAGVSLLAA